MVSLSIVLVPLLLLFLSIDSPFFEIWGRTDSSWYFTAGKAWVEGMIPYVDFSDSKGPLLWLIYGLGYLISNNDFVGVWILTCISYWITIWFIYGIVLLFIDSRWVALLVGILMLWCYFNPFMHYETRPEDFCQPFIAMSMWATCRVLYCKAEARHHIERLMRQGAWIIGIAIGASLLIKFTIATMITFFAIVLCSYSWYSKAIAMKSLVWRIGSGILLVCLPFVFYFCFLGNLDDFIKEYFVLTSKISSHSPRLNIVKWILGGGFLSSLIILMSLSTGTVFLLVKNYAWAPLATFWWFLLITVQNAEWTYYYYSCLIFAVFGFISISILASKLLINRKLNTVLYVLVLCGIGYASFYHASNNLANFKLVEHDNDPLKDMGTEYYHHVDIVKKVYKPHIVFFNYNNKVNVADATCGLPGCKYWAKQFGANNMQEMQYVQIKEKKPHFIYIKKSDFKNRERVESLGYFCLIQPGKFYNAFLYASPQLKKLYQED